MSKRKLLNTAEEVSEALEELDDYSSADSGSNYDEIGDCDTNHMPNDHDMSDDTDDLETTNKPSAKNMYYLIVFTLI